MTDYLRTRIAAAALNAYEGAATPGSSPRETFAAGTGWRWTDV